MAHITEFTIVGLAGREEACSQKLDRHVNLFFGLNGSGKTSLLRILNSAMTNDASTTQFVPFQHAEVGIYSITYDTVFTYSCEKKPSLPKSTSPETESEEETLLMRVRRTLEEKPPKLSWTVSPKLPKDFQGRWRHRYLPTSRLYPAQTPATARPADSLLLTEEHLDQYFASLVNQLWTTYSAEILGAVQKAQAQGLADILEALLGTRTIQKDTEPLDPTTAYEKVRRFLQRQGSKAIPRDVKGFETNYSQNKQLQSVVSDIDRVEQQIQKAMQPRDKLQGLIEGMFSGNKKVLFTDTAIEIKTKADTDIGLARLSSGEKHLLRIFIETLLAEENSVLIDEPEISMHVDWQRQLVPSMRQLNPGAQLILATHSPEIMANIEDKNIFRL